MDQQNQCANFNVKNNSKSKIEVSNIQVEEIETSTDMIVQKENTGLFEKIKNTK